MNEEEEGYNSDLDLLPSNRLGEKEDLSVNIYVRKDDGEVGGDDLEEAVAEVALTDSDVGKLLNPDGLSREERIKQNESEMLEKIQKGETEESRNDLDRLEEVRFERERAAARRTYELKKKEELRQKAAARALELENKKNAKGRKGGKKKGKKR